MPTVELEVEPNELGRHIPEGTPVELDYDSAYGGEQTVRGELDKLTEDEVYGRMTAGEARRIGQAKPGDVLIGDRILRRGEVRSVRDRRRLGRPTAARVRVPRDRALDVIDRYGSYDVDEHEDATVVQFWDTGYEGEAVMPHIEGGERVNPAYEPRTKSFELEDEDYF